MIVGPDGKPRDIRDSHGRVAEVVEQKAGTAEQLDHEQAEVERDLVVAAAAGVDLVGEVSGDWQFEFLALMGLDHQDNPEHQADDPDQT